MGRSLILSIATAVFCLAAAPFLVLTGCSSGKEAGPAGPQTPGDLIIALAGRASRADVGGLVQLLADDARTQSGKDWLAFINRAGSPSTVEGLGALSLAQRQELERLAGEEFLKKFYEAAPTGFGRMFSFYLAGVYEQEGRALVYAQNERGYGLYLGMERQPDGSLRLLGEQESKKVYAALHAKLDEKLRTGG